MIGDPMADMGPGAGAEQLQQPNDNASGGKEVVDPLVLQLNMQRIDHIHSVMGVASGCVAGILGMTGLQGFAIGKPNWGFEKPAVPHTKDPFRVYCSVCFFLLHTLVTLSIWAIKMKGQLRKYTRQSAFGFYTASIQPCLLSFTLFWTLFYGLVYLY